MIIFHFTHSLTLYLSLSLNGALLPMKATQY